MVAQQHGRAGHEWNRREIVATDAVPQGHFVEFKEFRAAEGDATRCTIANLPGVMNLVSSGCLKRFTSRLRRRPMVPASRPVFVRAD
jgi:hypothetical protein